MGFLKGGGVVEREPGVSATPLQSLPSSGILSARLLPRVCRLSLWVPFSWMVHRHESASSKRDKPSSDPEAQLRSRRSHSGMCLPCRGRARQAGPLEGRARDGRNGGDALGHRQPGVASLRRIENGRGFVGDLVLTLVLVGTVVVPLTLLRFIVPRYAMTTEISRFLVVLVPAILWVRLRAAGLRLWRARPIAQILIVGVGPLGRLTHREIRDTGKRRTVIGYLRFDDEQSHARLHAPVIGTVHDIEAVSATTWSTRSTSRARRRTSASKYRT
jgi:hypothetical protein